MNQRRPLPAASPLVGFAKVQNYMETQNSSSSSKKGKGGAREGAGRKPIEHGKNYTFRSNPAVDAILTSFEGNKTQFINEAIEHYFQLKR